MEQSKLGKRAKNILSQIQQAHNSPFARLKAHSSWQENAIQQLQSRVPHDAMNGQNSTSLPVEFIHLQQQMLTQLQNNTSFIQDIVHKQEKTIQKNSSKVSTMQNSFSWQVTGPIRATGTVLKNSPKLKASIENQLKLVNKTMGKIPLLKKLLKK